MDILEIGGDDFTVDVHQGNDHLIFLIGVNGQRKIIFSWVRIKRNHIQIF